MHPTEQEKFVWVVEKYKDGEWVVDSVWDNPKGAHLKAESVMPSITTSVGRYPLRTETIKTEGD